MVLSMASAASSPELIVRGSLYKGQITCGKEKCACGVVALELCFERSAHHFQLQGVPV